MNSRPPGWRKRMLRRRQYALVGSFAVFGLFLFGIWFFGTDHTLSAEAPEAQKVMDAQADIPFQILIPAYMPRQFDRSKAAVTTDSTGPEGSRRAQIAYHTGSGGAFFVSEYLPGNPEGDVLSGSQPIQTKWGSGWMLTSGEGLTTLWVMIGPLRVGLSADTNAGITREDVLEMANTLGPASNLQAFYYAPEKPVEQAAQLPPPEQIQVNDRGVQEFTLVITPGGYEPIRFAVKKGVPVRMTFRQLGQVGCGNILIFQTAGSQGTAQLTLKSERDKQVLDFTPEQVGDFPFYCAHLMYRGIMTVYE